MEVLKLVKISLLAGNSGSATGLWRSSQGDITRRRVARGRDGEAAGAITPRGCHWGVVKSSPEAPVSQILRPSPASIQAFLGSASTGSAGRHCGV